MNIMARRIGVIIGIGVVLFVLLNSFTRPVAKTTAINWMTWEEVQKAQEKEPRKVMVDLYTDWCGWCKKMDADAFVNEEVVKYVNANYYAVKFDAETDKDIDFQGKKYELNKSRGRNGTHALALYITQNNLGGYPTTVYLDEDFKTLTSVSSYLSATDLDAILHFFGEEAHLKESYDDYSKTFKSKAE